MTKQEMNASEAVYGFAAWLSCRPQTVKFGSRCNCAPLAELVKQFCDTNKLKEPRKNWQKRLTHPT
jgi:deoxyinosine 3'endonuclease (endonuclease V)